MCDLTWLKEELKIHFENEATGHDYWHALRVAKSAVHIGDLENANIKIVELAALLHDVADWKLDEERRSEGLSKMDYWMKKLGCSQDEMQHVYRIIEDISYKGGTRKEKPQTLEGRVVQDADRIDALGAIGIARAFAYGGSKGRPIHDSDHGPVEFDSFEAYKNHQGASVNHFYEKLLKLKALMNTDAGKVLAEERDAYMRAFLERFYMEWEGEM